MAREWNAHEDAVVTDYWGAVGLPELAERLGRTVEAVRTRAKRLGLPAYKHTAKTIHQIAAETGYPWTRIEAAAVRLGFEIERAGRYTRVRADQEEKILALIANYPDGGRLSKVPRGSWRGRTPNKCRRCRRTSIPHRARGYCRRCYARIWWRKNRSPRMNNGQHPHVEAAE